MCCAREILAFAHIDLENATLDCETSGSNFSLNVYLLQTHRQQARLVLLRERQVRPSSINIILAVSLLLTAWDSITSYRNHISLLLYGLVQRTTELFDHIKAHGAQSCAQTTLDAPRSCNMKSARPDQGKLQSTQGTLLLRPYQAIFLAIQFICG